MRASSLINGVQVHNIIKILITIFIIFLIAGNSMAESKAEVSNDRFDKDKFRSLLREYVFQTYKSEKGIHIESVLSALGALSGFALQQGIRQELISGRGMPENKVFSIVQTKDGGKYYFGEIFDQPLFDTRQGQVSVWVIVAGAAQKAGAKSLPNINLLAKHNAQTVGNPDYGSLTLPQNHQPIDHPLEAVKKHWAVTETLLKANGTEPLMWSWEIASVAAEIIILGKQAIPPETAAQLVMEPAISMSKIDPILVTQK
jgi:hypothetical protein